MRLVLLLILILAGSAFAANETIRYGTGAYFNPFLRAPSYVLNFTVDDSGVPWPSLTWRPPPQNTQRDYDVPLPPESPTSFDPNSCPGQIAHCYQRIQHNYTGEITYNENYTAASGYILPEQRIRTFVCIGNDTACTAQATGCFCPDEIPYAQTLPQRVGDCPLLGNVCQTTDSGALVICKANYTSCVEQYGTCGCGRYPTCSAGESQTCINDRNELVTCRGRIGQCVDNFKTCFCGTEMMALQVGCTETRHTCSNEGKNVTCIGSFGDCALKYDRCTCGT